MYYVLTIIILILIVICLCLYKALINTKATLDEVRFLKGRIKFELGKVAKNSATFPSMLVIMKNKNI